MSYAALIERLEKLEGPDREVDGLLFGRIHNTEPCGTFMCGFSEEKFQFRHPDDSPEGRYRAWYVSGDDVPAYTESIETAVALIERALPGWKWRVSNHQGEVFQRDPECGQDAFHATPAIALLIATLKALDQQHD